MREGYFLPPLSEFPHFTVLLFFLSLHIIINLPYFFEDEKPFLIHAFSNGTQPSPILPIFQIPGLSPAKKSLSPSGTALYGMKCSLYLYDCGRPKIDKIQYRLCNGVQHFQMVTIIAYNPYHLS